MVLDTIVYWHYVRDLNLLENHETKHPIGEKTDENTTRHTVAILDTVYIAEYA